MSEQIYEHCLMEQILRMMCPPRESAQSGPCERSASPEDKYGHEMTNAFIRFMDEMPGGVLIYYAGGGEEIIYANRSLLRIFRCETMEEFRELTGNSFRGIVHPEDLEAVEKSIRAQIAASQHNLDHVEYRIRAKDGSIRWIEDYGHFIGSDTVGDIFYVFLGDTTESQERKLAEKVHLVNEQLEREHKLQDLIEERDRERSIINREYLQQMEVIEGLSVDYESICYVDLDLDQLQPYRLGGRTPELFYEKLKDDRSYSRYVRSYVDLWVHPEDREMAAKAISPEYIRERLAETRTYYLNYRVLVDGELQYIQVRVVNVSRGDGVRQVVLGYRRVDEEIRQQMEQQALLAEALAKANLAITSKNTFLSNMSHDMQTPLHAIFGFTALAKLSIENRAEALDNLERVEAASRQLLDMIDKVLEMSSLSEASELEEVECNLREVVGDVHSFMEPQAQEKDIALTLECDTLRHKSVFTDREKLRQLMLYLANNAVTYTNPGGRVCIRVEEGEMLPSGYAVYRFTVEDTGIGISQEFLDRIFEPFSREKNSTLSGIHGIGLGLTIAKNIVDMMGGVLSVQSTVGKGSTFTAVFRFRVPAWQSAVRDSAGHDTAQRILLVEDNEINREIEMELLGELGFRIDTAENGKIAVEKVEAAAAGYYDVVLMDLQMPVMNGWEASVAIRGLRDQAKAAVPIIALSANALECDRRRSQKSGINAHLRKPMDLAALLRTIEELTGEVRLS